MKEIGKGQSDYNHSVIKPFLKWAGGKRWFVEQYANLLQIEYNRYIEPFLGSGAVFFHLMPKTAILSDSNKELINTYKAIKKNWPLVYRYLKEHHKRHSKKYFYTLRKSTTRSVESAAARFIYLNRTCWNGLYRVNRSGAFNVPIGTRTSVIFENDDFEQISEYLKNAKLYSCDFEKIIDMAGKNDLVFVDPPYTVSHNNNSFIKYNEKLFSWNDQERLCKALERAKTRGVKIIGTNACHEKIKNLYKNSFILKTVARNSLISGKKDARGTFEELIILMEDHQNE